MSKRKAWVILEVIMKKDFLKSVSFLVILVVVMIVLKVIDSQTGFFTRMAVGMYERLLG